MDLFLNICSTDLTDSNNETSFTATKAFKDMLSKKLDRREIFDKNKTKIDFYRRYFVEIDRQRVTFGR